MLLTVFGYFRQFLSFIRLLHVSGVIEKDRKGYVPLYDSYEAFYTKNVYRRIRDAWNRPICATPGIRTQVMERSSPDYGWSFSLTGRSVDCVNLGSYNYLGFANSTGACSDDAKVAIEEGGVAFCTPRGELGNNQIVRQLDATTAEFLGTEDAVTFAMGFATNANNIPILGLAKNALILSDELNHASIVAGCKLSGAKIKTFKHNNVDDLEKKLKEAIVYGHHRTRRPWKKILVLVEGVYSMEGTICPLPQILELKKKYKFYVWLDEAHSIGAVGDHGRGVCDLYNIKQTEVDLLMGTFTKSFGAAGGYIAGPRKTIEYIRRMSHSFPYGASITPAVAQQIITSFNIIMGKDNTNIGSTKLKQIRINSKYFRQELQKRGFIVYGNDYSPVVPLMIYMPSKIAALNRELLKKGVAAVCVGFPATPLLEGRARFCLSSDHTREALDQTIEAIDACGNKLGLKYSRRKISTAQ